MPSLVLFPKPGRSSRLYNIFRRITSIGAASDNDIVIQDDSLASVHAHILFEQRNYIVTAMDRAGEVFVNGKRIRRQVLADGDVLRLGELTFQFGLADIATREFLAERSPGKNSLQWLLEFTSVLVEPKPINEMLLVMLDQLLEVTGADKGFVILLDGGRPLVHVARNIDQELLDSETGFSDSIVRKTIKTLSPVLVSDAMSDSEFSGSASVVGLKLCSVMCVPLLVRGELLGVLYLGNDNVVSLFDQESLDLLQVFSGQAGLLIRNAMLINELQVRNADLTRRLEEIRFGEIIGSSPAMQEIFRKVEKVAFTDIGVLLLGETGVGKELFARELHRRSNRAQGPFVAINASAIPESLLESELFGHEKGAYTGAHASAAGKFQAAHKGTLFLDEIGDLPLPLQAKLLRAIEQKQVTRVGATKAETVDIRILAATHRNLNEAVASGTFRQDLFYRLNAVVLAIPPLRDRGRDILYLAHYFLKRFAATQDVPARPLSPASEEVLARHPWPGNVRELENRIRKALILCEGPFIEPADLDLSLKPVAVQSLAEAKEEFQRQYVARILAANGGNRVQTARDLDVDPRTIFRYLEKNREGEN